MINWVTLKQIDKAATAVKNRKGPDKVEEINAIMEKRLFKAYILRFLASVVPPALACAFTGPTVLSCFLATGWFAASMTVSGCCLINPRVLREYQKEL